MAIKPIFFDRVKSAILGNEPVHVFGAGAVSSSSYRTATGLSMREMFVKAVPMVIDDTALRTALDLRIGIMQHKRVVLPDIARVPFEYTWLEYDPRIKVPEYDPLLTSQHVGHLIVRTDTGATVLTFERNAKSLDEGFVILPMTFNWTTEPQWTAPWRLLIGNEHAEVLPPEHTESIRQMLLTGKRWTPAWARRCGGDLYQRQGGKTFNKSLDTMLEQSRSAQSLLMTLLALCAWCPTERVRVKPSGRWIHRGRTRPYAEHSTVKIVVPIRKVYQEIERAQRGIHRRRHRVREHLRVYHRGTAREKVVVVPEHLRGDASLGWVDQDYVIEGRKDDGESI